MKALIKNKKREKNDTYRQEVKEYICSHAKYHRKPRHYAKEYKMLIDKLLNNNEDDFVGVLFHTTTQGNVAVNFVGCGVSMQA